MSFIITLSKGELLTVKSLKSPDTIDGLIHTFTRRNIDYSVFIKSDCIDVWKDSNQRNTRTVSCYWDFLDHERKPMAKFLKQVIEALQTNDLQRTH